MYFLSQYQRTLLVITFVITSAHYEILQTLKCGLNSVSVKVRKIDATGFEPCLILKKSSKIKALRVRGVITCDYFLITSP